jgi:RimJ/RimL family protein N-acetyltransferase
MPELLTERLVLRPLELADAVQVEPLFAQWEVVKYLNGKVPWPFPEDGALEYYREVALPAMARGEEWHWTLRLKTEPDKVIGAIGLMKPGAAGNPEENNRGFWLDPQWQGRGLMTEAVVAVNDYWFEVLGFEMLRAPKAVANAASSAISRKTGMRLVEVKLGEYVSGRLETEVWEITREEWREWKGSKTAKGSGLASQQVAVGRRELFGAEGVGGVDGGGALGGQPGCEDGEQRE